MGNFKGLFLIATHLSKTKCRVKKCVLFLCLIFACNRKNPKWIYLSIIASSTHHYHHIHQGSQWIGLNREQQLCYSKPDGFSRCCARNHSALLLRPCGCAGCWDNLSRLETFRCGIRNTLHVETRRWNGTENKIERKWLRLSSTNQSIRFRCLFAISLRSEYFSACLLITVHSWSNRMSTMLPSTPAKMIWHSWWQSWIKRGMNSQKLANDA